MVLICIVQGTCRQNVHHRCVSKIFEFIFHVSPIRHKESFWKLDIFGVYFCLNSGRISKKCPPPLPAVSKFWSSSADLLHAILKTWHCFSFLNKRIGNVVSKKEQVREHEISLQSSHILHIFLILATLNAWMWQRCCGKKMQINQKTSYEFQ